MEIKWFWEILSELFQNELSNLLFFATSSSRVTLGGFIELEKTNGKLCRFKLEYDPYVKNRKNFLKSHTCFNRNSFINFKSLYNIPIIILFISIFNFNELT